ncbi:MAG: hypothetical protein NC356_05425 [Ruminococcus sp.]|nr:hypothetical protein [Ruminococcus sp.]
MKVKVKNIHEPKLEKATRLTLLQLNGMRPDNKHTVLTPELFREMAQRKEAASSK